MSVRGASENGTQPFRAPQPSVKRPLDAARGRRLSRLKWTATLRLVQKCCSPRTLRLLLQLRRYRSARLSQQEELQNLLSFCIRRVPYYKRAFASLAIDRGVQFQDLPIMTKATVQQNFADLIAVNPGGVVQGSAPLWITNTSGSTGVPSSFLKSRADMLANMSAVTDIFRQHGVPKVGHIFDLGLHWSGQPLVEARVLPGAFVCWNFRAASFDTANLRQECLDVLATTRPKVIFGAPSRLIPFADLCASAGAVLRPDLVVTTYEHLSHAGSHHLSEAFGCPVVQLYGTAETGLAGWTCAVGRWHFDPQAVAVELVAADEGYTAAGECGRLLITPLGRRTMPLIRFDTGDIGRCPTGPCPCGRAGPVVDAVEGRASELLETSSGKLFSPFAVFRYISDLGVTDWQLVQRRPGEIEIVLPEGVTVRDHEVERIAARISTYFEEEATVVVRPGGDFILATNGKRNAFVRFDDQ